MAATTVGFVYAVLAGSTAAMASVFGKLAMDSSHLSGLVRILFPSGESSDSIVRILQGCCIGMIILCNMGMWSLFVRALDRLPSSLIATAVNTAVNFFLSAFLGSILFGEGLPVLWWAGASIILLGLLLLNHSKPAEDSKEKVN